MIKDNYFTDNKDMLLHFNELIDWEEIVKEYEGDYLEAKEYQKTGKQELEMAPSSVEEAIDYYKEILNSYGDLAGNEVSPHVASFDSEGLKYENGKVTHPEKMAELVNVFHDAGLPPAGFLRKYGGLGLPHVVKGLLLEIMYRCDTSFAIAMGSVVLASILQDICDEEQKQRILPKLIKERYSVTMGLSEPDFGSDLASVKTKAEKRDGKWYITGTKRFQTVACGINGAPSATLCLARTGSPTSGAKGLSFFLVDGKDYEIAGIEKKMGIKASATCEVVMNDAPAELLGKEGYGLTRYVMGMLNGARMSVGSMGAGMSTASYFESLKYATERVQFGKPLKEIPAVKRMLDRMEREIAGMRNLLIEGARTVDLYSWRNLRGKDEGIDEKTLRRDPHILFWNTVSSAMTPLAKYYNAETANSLCYDAIQIFGGSGFCEDYDVARIYRDVRIASIWDGTSQIQVNAAIGPVVVGINGTGPFGEYLKQKIDGITPSAELTELYSGVKKLVEYYKGLPDSKTKEYYSVDVVHNVSRFLIGLLFEEQEKKIKSTETLAHRKIMREDFNVDSLGQIDAAIRKLSRVK
ncbi:MAG: acyl-CoA dehydrogenase family protein [Leptospiraceae bacterium]|nr:acyl-CoA dehydrogenase family protein [Leptospiraceae bacterium]